MKTLLTFVMTMGVIVILFTPVKTFHYSPMPAREMACGRFQASLARQIERYNREHAVPLVRLPDEAQATNPLNLPGVLTEPVHRSEPDCFFRLTPLDNGRIGVQCFRHGAGVDILAELKARQAQQVRHTAPIFRFINFVRVYFFGR